MSQENSSLKEEGKDEKITYFLKNPFECPLCQSSFKREELLSGRGRLIAEGLSHDLRRSYQVSKKYGRIYPLIYTIVVCPRCFYAAFPQDFFIADKKVQDLLKNQEQSRKDLMLTLFSGHILDFEGKRSLETGLASYVLAMHVYESFPRGIKAPTFKQALCALRSAWLCEDLHQQKPHEHYRYLQKIFYHKAQFLYNLTVKRESEGSEPLGEVKSFGPDTDHNYGYDGVLYLSGLFDFSFGSKLDPKMRYKILRKTRVTLSRIVGMGKSNKAKPSIFVEKSREIYKEIGKEFRILDKELNNHTAHQEEKI